MGGPFAEKLWQTFLKVAKTLVEEGHPLIIDDVPEQRHLNEWKATLKGHSTLFVGVTAPVAVLEAREQARGNRTKGSARSQHVSSPMDLGYDLVLDTHAVDLDHQVEAIRQCVYGRVIGG